jgi:thiol-disulfide isomerase/thioredoxin
VTGRAPFDGGVEPEEQRSGEARGSVQDQDSEAAPRKTGRAWLREGLFLLAVVVAIGAYQTRELPSGKVPSFALPTLSGGVFSDRQLAGTPTVLVFWAPWCGVCRFESQNVSWLKVLVGDHAKVISIAAQYDDRAEVEAFVRERAVDYPVLLGGRAVSRRFGVRAFPTLFFLGEDGQIKRAAVGYTTMFGLLWRLFL